MVSSHPVTLALPVLAAFAEKCLVPERQLRASLLLTLGPHQIERVMVRRCCLLCTEQICWLRLSYVDNQYRPGWQPPRLAFCIYPRTLAVNVNSLQSTSTQS